jgi:hypothetical protein
MRALFLTALKADADAIYSACDEFVTFL